MLVLCSDLCSDPVQPGRPDNESSRFCLHVVATTDDTAIMFLCSLLIVGG